MGKKVASRKRSMTFRFEKSGSPKKRWQKSSSSTILLTASSFALVGGAVDF